MDIDIDDIEVLVCHTWKDLRVPLRDWMKIGPGPRNAFPLKARRISTGEQLPLTVIPFAYRFDQESEQAIRDGLIEDPWPDQKNRQPYEP